MRIAYLDCFSGISGDMFLGALVDAGVPFELLQRTVSALKVGATLEQSRVDRSGISATKVDVLISGQKDLPREEFLAEKPDHNHAAGHGHSQGRHLSHILTIIAAAPISDSAKQSAGRIFNALGEAEAKVHNLPIEKVHFHEVGAADAIVDIVCAAVGVEALQLERIVASPLNVGGGTVKCAHGIMPVPAPATLELLKGVPVYSGEVEKELVTPTGAAIVRTLASGFGSRPAMTTQKVGYGAGARDFSGFPNVLRLAVGDLIELRDANAQEIDVGAGDEVEVMEANLDDLNPQVIGYAAERLLAEGALDVFNTAVQMKKGRPGTLLTVLARPQDADKLRGILLQETSTLGVRSRRDQRRVLQRRYETVKTPWGEVRIKIGSLEGHEMNAAPEYEDCRAIASENRVPLKSVMQEALRLYLETKNG
jgi:pyridinium-3,5-bisthiocarboxylic acid mononucleotide nickel chelatase